MKKLCFTLLFSAVVFVSKSQSLFTTHDSLNAFCDQVMQKLSERKFSEAMQMFRQKSVIDTITIKNMDKTLVDQMMNLEPYYKKITGYEFVEDRVIKSVVQRRYILKFEYYFITVDFVLYNSSKGWTVSNFNYYDNPKELFGGK
ncbi:MAG TPA: hypothetical protein VHL77_01115 [Ferruginibacter sp.]|jgi:hypothetical protein|nr:hypothetical protein [Ferruginibacter sp.]